MATKKSPGKVKISGRPKPQAPKAGYSAGGHRYGCGGKKK